MRQCWWTLHCRALCWNNLNVCLVAYWIVSTSLQIAKVTIIWSRFMYIQGTATEFKIMVVNGMAKCWTSCVNVSMYWLQSLGLTWSLKCVCVCAVWTKLKCAIHVCAFSSQYSLDQMTLWYSLLADGFSLLKYSFWCSAVAIYRALVVMYICTFRVCSQHQHSIST